MVCPIIIVLEGAVAAGKSRLFEKLKNKLQGSEYCFMSEPDFTYISLSEKTYNPLFEIYQSSEASDSYVCTQQYITRTLADFYFEQWKNAPITIMDRSILSCEYFIRLRKHMKLITTYTQDCLLEEVKRYQEIFLKLIEGTKTYYCLLDTPPEQSSLNVFKRGRPEETTNKSIDYWKKFNKDYVNIIKSYSPKIDFQGNAKELENIILTLCKTALGETKV